MCRNGRTMLFQDREDAGKKLAEALKKEFAGKNVLIYALPRGGVPVAYEVAKVLDAPLDTIVARKIGALDNPEFAVGAIAPGDVLILDEESIRAWGIGKKELEEAITKETREMERRVIRYDSGKYAKENTADHILLVDDGLATGMTALAALESVRIQYPGKKVVLASPICARETSLKLRQTTPVVCVSEVDNLMAIGRWYEKFDQVSDEEVIELLQKANRERLRQ